MSIIIGWVAIVWGLFICVVLMLPNTYPITGAPQPAHPACMAAWPRPGRQALPTRHPKPPPPGAQLPTTSLPFPPPKK